MKRKKNFRRCAALISMFAMLAGLLPANLAWSAAGDMQYIYPNADSHVQIGKGNLGGEKALVVKYADDGKTDREAFIRFDVSEYLDRELKTVKFALNRVGGSSGVGLSLLRAENHLEGEDTLWGERDVTWDKKPAELELIQEFKSPDSSIAINITDYIVEAIRALPPEEPYLTFKLKVTKVGTQGADFTSKEGATDDALPPLLVVTCAPDENYDAIENTLDLLAVDDTATEDFLLQTQGEDGAVVSWESDQPDVISIDGESAGVTRPTGGEDALVALTATVSKGGKQKTKAFFVTVPRLISEEELVDQTLAELDLGVEEGRVKHDLVLPSEGIGGTVISWQSDRPDVISISGKVTRGGENINVMLTATAENGTIRKDRVFPVTVLADITDEEAVRLDAAALSIPETVRENLSLPTIGTNDSKIVWESSDEEVIAPDGTVTRPPWHRSDVEVTLAATVSRGSVSQRQEFTVTVKKEEFFRDDTLKAAQSAFLRYNNDTNNSTGGDKDYLLVKYNKNSSTDRYGLLQFDLSGVAGEVVKAELVLTKQKIAGSGSASASLDQKLSFLDNDDWDEMTITGKNCSIQPSGKIYDHMVNPKNVIASFTAKGSGEEVFTLDVTDAVAREAAGDKKASFGIASTTANSTFTTYFYSSRYSDEAKRPQLLVTVSYGPEIGAIEIAGSDQLPRPVDGEANWFQYTASVTDNGGGAMEWEPAEFSLAEPARGITVAPDGTVQVAPDAADSFRIAAHAVNAPAVKTEKTVSVYDPIPQKLEITGDFSIGVPETETRYTYSGQVLDQNGIAYQRQTFRWSFENEKKIPGVSFDEASATLSATQKVRSGAQFFLSANSDRFPDLEPARKQIVVRYAENSMQHPYGLYTNDDLPAIREWIRDPALSEKYDNITRTADRYTLEELENIDGIKPWREYSMQFTPPAGAASIEYHIRMQGIGEAYFDKYKLLKLGYGDEELYNTGFEVGVSEPDGWRFNANGTGASGGWVSSEQAGIKAADGKMMVKLKNETVADEGEWIRKDIAVTPGQQYIIYANISMLDVIGQPDPRDELFGHPFTDDGVYLSVVYKDKDGKAIGSAESNRFNRITNTMRTSIINTGAAAANVYMIEGKKVYAEKAKQILFYCMRDMAWGSDYYRRTKNNLDDTYMAVHIGRALGVTSIMYDQIASAGVIAPEEDTELRSLFYQVADMLMNKDYFDTGDLKSRQRNYNTDRCTGLGKFCIIFPEYEKSAQYLEHAIGELNWQLYNFVGEDAMWPETVRYHGAIMDHWIPFAKMLKKFNGYDFFEEPRFKKMLRSYMEVQIPRDKASTAAFGLSGNPAIGDATWRETQYILGMAANEYQKTDPQFAAELLFAWDRAGRVTGGYMSLYELLFFHYDQEEPMQSPKLTSKLFGNIGYPVFRQNYDTDSEDYMIVSSSPTLVSHSHFDRGGFSLWADSTALSLDPSVAGYKDGSSDWIRSSEAHNVVQFYDSEKKTYQNGPNNSSVGAFFASGNLDYTRIDILDAKADSYERHIAFVKNGFDVYVIWDAIESQNSSKINFHTLSTKADINENTISAYGYNGMNLDISFLNPAQSEIESDWGSIQPGYPLIDGNNVQQKFNVKNAAGEDYLTLLYPKKRGEKGLETELLSEADGVKAYRVRDKNGREFLFAINGSDQPKQVGFAERGTLVDMMTGDAYAPDAPVTIPAKQPVFLMDSAMKQKAVEIQIEGQTWIDQPTAGTNTQKYFARVIGEFGNVMENREITYSVLGDVPGASVNAKTGELTVEASVKPGTMIAVAASAEGLTGTLQVKVEKYTPRISGVVTAGLEQVSLPVNGAKEIAYRGTVVDRFGAPMADERLEWALVDSTIVGAAAQTEGVSCTANGIVKIASSVPEGTMLALRARAVNDPAVSDTVYIELIAPNPKAIEIQGASQITIIGDTKTSIYTAIVSENGQPTSEAVTWSIEAGNTGAVIDDNGLVTIPGNAASGTIRVKAALVSDPTVTQVKTVSIVRRSTSDEGSGGTTGGGNGGGSHSGGTISPPIIPGPGTGQPEDRTAFPDVPKTFWGYEAIEALRDRGVIAGKEEGLFVPDDTVTRAEFVKMLVGTMELPVGGTAEYGDVTAEDWFAPFVAAAQAAGIVSGYPDGTFHPNDPVTREDMAVMITRAAEAKGLKFSEAMPLQKFADDSEIAEYAALPVETLQKAGILSGSPDGAFRPKAGGTRAETASVFYRILKLL